MKKSKILLFISLFVISKYPFAQYGGILFAGANIPKLVTSDINTKTSTGFTISYGAFSNYTDNLQWTSSFGFSQAALLFSGYDGLQLTNSGFSDLKFVATEKSVNHYLINYDYKLHYYIIPDHLSIMGGIAFSFIYTSWNKNTNADENSFFLSSQNLDQLVLKQQQVRDLIDSYKAIENPEIKTGNFNFGPVVGLDLTIAEKYLLIAQYNLFVNSYLNGSNNLYSQFIGNGRMGQLQLGIGYKFWATTARKRY